MPGAQHRKKHLPHRLLHAPAIRLRESWTADTAGTASDTADAKIYNEYGKVNISDAKGSRLTIQAESSDCQIDRLQFSDTEIENEYGNISLGLPGDLDSYGFDLRAEYGDIRVGSTEHVYGDGFGEMTYRTAGDGKKRISVDCESGNIDIYPSE